MKTILAEAEEKRSGGRTRYPSASPLTPVQPECSRSGDGDSLRVTFSLPKKMQGELPLLQSSSPGTSRAAPGSSPGHAGTGMISRTPPRSTQASADGMRVAFSLPKTLAGGLPPHSSTPGGSRAVSASTPAWRVPSLSVEPSNSGSPPGRPMIARTPSRTPPPPGATQVSKEASPAAQRFTAPASALQKSRSAQGIPGPSTPRPSLGPLISPSKAKAGLTVTRPASYVAPPFSPRYGHKYSLPWLVLYS
jgi:hypothetical protein